MNRGLKPRASFRRRMGEQYFANRPSSRRRPSEIRVVLRGHSLTFRSDAGVFSREAVDRGTHLLIDALDLGPKARILDLGCGYGAIGIVASRLTEGGHVILTDVNRRAVALARANLTANGITNAEVREGDLYAPVAGLAFDDILSNPPIRAGRAVVDQLISDAPAHLPAGGHLWLVARTKQGAESIRARMIEAFGNATVVRRGSGFKVLRSVKEVA